MMLAMNALRYDAMAVGNHEFNFGLKNLERARADAAFPWIAANIDVAPGGRERPFAPYIVKTLGGVKVAVIGVTTPAVPTWEEPEQLGLTVSGRRARRWSAPWPNCAAWSGRT